MEGGTSKKDSNTLKVPGAAEPQKRTTTFKNLLDSEGNRYGNDVTVAIGTDTNHL
jgi:hypothetical protein